jgi:DNA-binding IclR family transcriptional regulator
MPRPTTTSRRLSSSRSNWPRSTFYRHLKLLREMQWIRVDQAGRRIVIRPIIVRNNQIVGRQLARTG